MFRSAAFTVLLFALCAASFLAQTSRFRAAHSLTFDETLYLSLTVRSVHSGTVDPGFVNSGIAPLPMLLTYVPSLWRDPGEDRTDGWAGRLDDPQRIVGPRRNNAILIGLPLLALVFVWLLRRQGRMAAAIGGLLLAGSPTILAHGGLATTELSYALLSLVSLLLIARLSSSFSWSRLTFAGLSIGVALAAKYSALFLLPTAGLVLAHAEFSARVRPSLVRSSMRIVLRYSLLLTVAFAACWAGHLFTTAGPLKMTALEETAAYSPWLRWLGRGPLADWIMTTAHEDLLRPAPVEGIFFQVRHNAEGHSAYLCGEVSQFGWWYYFPSAFLFKSTPVELALLMFLIAAMGASPRLLWRKLRSLDHDQRTLLVGALILLGLLLSARINIGHRYLILFYPLLVMTAVERLMRFRASRPRGVAIAATLLIAGQFSSAAAIGPHYLAYFNSLVGGPDHGRWLLEDSNLDWGQDLPSLREFHSHHPGRLLLWYFGTALPQAYDIRATNLEDFPLSIEEFHYAALSASYLMGPYGPRTEVSDPFAPLRMVPPLAVLGHSIVVLDLREPGVRSKLQSAIDEYQRLAQDDPKHNPPRWSSTE